MQDEQRRQYEPHEPRVDPEHQGDERAERERRELEDVVVGVAEHLFRIPRRRAGQRDHRGDQQAVHRRVGDQRHRDGSRKAHAHADHRARRAAGQHHRRGGERVLVERRSGASGPQPHVPLYDDGDGRRGQQREAQRRRERPHRGEADVGRPGDQQADPFDACRQLGVHDAARDEDERVAELHPARRAVTRSREDEDHRDGLVPPGWWPARAAAAPRTATSAPTESNTRGKSPITRRSCTFIRTCNIGEACAPSRWRGGETAMNKEWN